MNLPPEREAFNSLWGKNMIEAKPKGLIEKEIDGFGLKERAWHLAEQDRGPLFSPEKDLGLIGLDFFIGFLIKEVGAILADF